MKRLLITGVSGFVGEEIFKYFNNKNYLIYGIDKVFPNFQINKNNFYKADLNNENLVKKILIKIKPEFVIHAASIILDETEKKKNWDTNYYATLKLAIICNLIKVKNFIFISTFSIFEKNSRNLIKETDLPTYNTVYGLTKYYAENALLRIEFNGVITILRCPIIIGQKRGYRFGILYDFIKENLKIPLIGLANNKLSFLHVFDLSVAIEKCLKLEKNQVLNLCSNKQISFARIINYLINKYKSKSKIIYIPKFIGNILFDVSVFLKLVPYNRYHKKIFNNNVVLDNSKARRVLGWNPKYTIKEMFSENFNFHLKSKKYFNNSSISSKKAKLGILKILKYFL
jgi:UDP-glucose 4-epimerase